MVHSVLEYGFCRWKLFLWELAIFKYRLKLVLLGLVLNLSVVFCRQELVLNELILHLRDFYFSGFNYKLFTIIFYELFFFIHFYSWFLSQRIYFYRFVNLNIGLKNKSTNFSMYPYVHYLYVFIVSSTVSITRRLFAYSVCHFLPHVRC